MEGDPDPRPEVPGDDEDELRHRQLGELLQEMRVALPGVQVLLAFLLTVPFQQRFATVGTFGHNLYIAALLFAAAAVGLLVGPTAYHRILFGRHDVDHVIKVGNRMAIAGLACLMLAIACAIALATSLVDRHAVAAAFGAGTLLFLAMLWFVLPLLRRRLTA